MIYPQSKVLWPRMPDIWYEVNIYMYIHIHSASDDDLHCGRVVSTKKNDFYEQFKIISFNSLKCELESHHVGLSVLHENSEKGEYGFLSFYIILIEIGVCQQWQHKDDVSL